MNTAKIAALCAFSDCQRYLTQDASAGRNLYFDHVTRRALRDDVPAGGTTYAVSIDDHARGIRRVDDFGDRQYDLLQVDCPTRVYAWALKQLPAEDNLAPDQGERWSATVAIHPTKDSGEEPTFKFCISSAESFAVLLRGMRAYQAKRRKYARKVLAQVKAYHLQQAQAAALSQQQSTAAADASRALLLETVRAGSVLPAVAAPALSCLRLPTAEYHRRVSQAEAQEAQQQQKYGHPDAQYGREIMWHPSFAAEFVTAMGHLPLQEVCMWLDGYLAAAYNGGAALDLIDYGYLADVLRDSLASNPAPLAALRLSRTLAWVNMEGERLLAAPIPALLATVAAPFPMTAAA